MTEPSFTILLVENNESIRKTLCQQLNGLGYDITPTRDEIGALKQINNNFDLLIIEIDLPLKFGSRYRNGNGIEIAQKFRAINNSIGIIFYSYNEKYMEKVESIYYDGNGGVGFVSKEGSVNIVSTLPPVLAGNWVCIMTKFVLSRHVTEETFLSGLSVASRTLVLEIVKDLHYLTDDEILTLGKIGESNQAIANELHVALNTIETRFTNIYAKLRISLMDRRLRVILLDRALSIHNLHSNTIL